MNSAERAPWSLVRDAHELLELRRRERDGYLASASPIDTTRLEELTHQFVEADADFKRLAEPWTGSGAMLGAPPMACKGTVQAHGGTYEYEAAWTVSGDAASWSARVRREGDIKGVPGGLISNVPAGADVEALVRHHVESDIRLRVGINK